MGQRVGLMMGRILRHHCCRPVGNWIRDRESDFVAVSAILDPNIYEVAKRFIDQHGVDADKRAMDHAQHSLEFGDIDGARVWHRILRAIEEVQRGAREGEAVN